MEIDTTRDGDITNLAIAGSIDFATSKDVEHAVDVAIDGGSRRLVFDLRQVGYVSSAGLRTILAAAKKAKSAGGAVSVFGLQAGVEEVFTISGFGKLVPIGSSDAEAREMLGD
jgi:anti-sigma B factor antagonist